MKRFTETTKWDQPWFRRLSHPTKSLWQFLNDHCDNAGVVDPDLELATFQIGEAVQEKNVAELGERVHRLPNGKLWLPDFIRTQFGELSPASKVHQSVIKLIQSHNLPYLIPPPTNGQPMPKTCLSPMDKEKENDKEKKKERGVGETNSQVVNQSFIALKLANQIVSNQSGWHYDNCQVARAALNPAGLRTIIEPFARRLSEKQILSCWAEAVRLAHGAKVDRLARNATAYAVECFKSQLKEKGKL